MNRLFKVTNNHRRADNCSHFITVTNTLAPMADDCAMVIGDFIRTNLPGNQSDYSVTEIDAYNVVVLSAHYQS